MWLSTRIPLVSYPSGFPLVCSWISRAFITDPYTSHKVNWWWYGIYKDSTSTPSRHCPTYIYNISSPKKFSQYSYIYIHINMGSIAFQLWDVLFFFFFVMMKWHAYRIIVPLSQKSKAVIFLFFNILFFLPLLISFILYVHKLHLQANENFFMYI